MISDRIKRIKPNFRVWVIANVWCPPMVDSSTISHHQRNGIVPIKTTPAQPAHERVPVRANKNPGRKQPSAIASMAL